MENFDLSVIMVNGEPVPIGDIEEKHFHIMSKEDADLAIAQIALSLPKEKRQILNRALDRCLANEALSLEDAIRAEMGG